MRPRATFSKRQKEQARQEKARMKAQRKVQRKLEKQTPGQESDTEIYDSSNDDQILPMPEEESHP